MKATTWTGNRESTVVPVDEGCTAKYSTPAASAVLRSTHEKGEEPAAREGREVVITKRTALLVVVLGALAAWLAAAATSGVRLSKPVASARPQIDARGAVLAAEIERLHDRLRPTVAPENSRNLFRFAPARAAAAPAGAVESPAAAPALPVAPAAPVEPPFKLIGVAEDGGVRTAILTSPSQLLMVKAGDSATSAYRVTGISADAVELTATSDGSVLRLALK
jgi:hypothetical protein